MNDTGMMSLLRKLEMTEKRQTEALEQTKQQIAAIRDQILAQRDVETPKKK